MIHEPTPPHNAVMLPTTPGLANSASRWRKEEGREITLHSYGDVTKAVFHDTLLVEDRTKEK